MDPPDRLVGERGEERGMDRMSNLHDGSTNIFAKTLLIAQFFTKSNTPYKDDLLTKDGNLENLSWNQVVNRWWT